MDSTEHEDSSRRRPVSPALDIYSTLRWDEGVAVGVLRACPRDRRFPSARVGPADSRPRGVHVSRKDCVEIHRSVITGSQADPMDLGYHGATMKYSTLILPFLTLACSEYEVRQLCTEDEPAFDIEDVSTLDDAAAACSAFAA